MSLSPHTAAGELLITHHNFVRAVLHVRSHLHSFVHTSCLFESEVPSKVPSYLSLNWTQGRKKKDLPGLRITLQHCLPEVKVSGYLFLSKAPPQFWFDISNCDGGNVLWSFCIKGWLGGSLTFTISRDRRSSRSYFSLVLLRFSQGRGHWTSHVRILHLVMLSKSCNLLSSGNAGRSLLSQPLPSSVIDFILNIHMHRLKTVYSWV